jgi:hypothetical protein
MNNFKYSIIFIVLTFFIEGVSAQNVGIGTSTPDGSALLDIDASPSNDRGVLIPRVALVSANNSSPITAPAVSLLIYNTATAGTYPDDVSPGYYYWNATAWIAFEIKKVRYYSIDDGLNTTTSSTLDLPVAGMSLTPGLGTYSVQFNGQCDIADAISTTGLNTADLVIDLNLIYDQIQALTVTDSLRPLAFGAGETITPGVYDLTGAIALTGALILDGASTSNPFVFICSGAFNAAAGTSVTMINGASSNNIIWLAEGAIGIAANVTIPGTIFSNTAAVAVGTNCTISGRLLSKAGAISFGAGQLSLPPPPSFINLYGLEPFVIFTALGAVANAGASTYTGNIGTNGGAITGFDAIGCIVNGILFPAGSTAVLTPIDHVATFSLYQNGILIPNSERTLSNPSVICLQGTATLLAGQAIEVRWKVDSQISDTGGQVSVSNRILTVAEVR